MCFTIVFCYKNGIISPCTDLILFFTYSLYMSALSCKENLSIVSIYSFFSESAYNNEDNQSDQRYLCTIDLLFLPLDNSIFLASWTKQSTVATNPNIVLFLATTD